MRAIIPVAGIGTRLRPFTHTLPKVLVNVAGKPILGHIIDALVEQDVDEVTIVTGYKGDLVEAYLSENYSLDFDFVVQEEMLGLGHAIWTARRSLDTDSPVLIILGDTVFDVDLGLLKTSQFSSLGVKHVDDPRRFGVVVKEGEFVTRLIEKPEHPVSNNAIVGIYYIHDPRHLRTSLERIIEQNIRTKNEYQLTDALQLMVDGGEKFTTFDVDGWHDCGKPETLLETNRYLLTKRSTTATPEGCVVIPPVHIDPTATVEHCVIGPYASISKGAVVRNSIVRDSIICDQSSVSNITLDRSIIGENAIVTGKYASINIGDASNVNLSQ
jgi:glucose-1-phosphate thymidylyltransferase